MYVPYTIFDKFTGQITEIGGCEEKDVMTRLASPTTHALLLGKYDICNWYIDPENLTPKKRRIMLLSVKGQTVCGVPLGATFKVKELEDELIIRNEEGCLEVDFPGHYHVIVEHPWYYPSKVTITVE